MADDSLLMVDSSRLAAKSVNLTVPAGFGFVDAWPDATGAPVGLFIFDGGVTGLPSDPMRDVPVGCRCKLGWRSRHGSSERREREVASPE